MADDSKWKLSGAIGAPPDNLLSDPQVMTQGLGFPLRPVDGAPSEAGEEYLENLPPIAEGMFMQWMGAYTGGLLYPRGACVRDGAWTMVANKNTVEQAAPQPDGAPEYALPDVPSWTGDSNLSVVYSGHLYEFTTGGWIKQIRIWVNELSGTTNYRVAIYDITDINNPKYQAIEEPVLNLDDWTILVSSSQVVYPGTKLFIYIDALNSGGDTLVTGGWTSSGIDNNLNPPTAGWNRSQQNTVLRIDKTDLDTVNRSSELLGMIPGTSVLFSETADSTYSARFQVNGAAVDNGTAVTYDVVLASAGPNGMPRDGSTTTMTATVPVAQTTNFVRIPGGVPTPTWATVTGYLAYDGVDQPAPTDAFGVDIQFQPAIVSEDWDVIATE